jgi:hypothetical protein
MSERMRRNRHAGADIHQPGGVFIRSAKPLVQFCTKGFWLLLSATAFFPAVCLKSLALPSFLLQPGQDFDGQCRPLGYRQSAFPRPEQRFA